MKLAAASASGADLPSREIWPLAIHIVCEFGPSGVDDTTRQIQLFADRLCAELSIGERTAGVPIRLWSGMRREDRFDLPPHFDCSRSSKALILALVDQRLFESRSDWGSYFKTLSNQLRDGVDLLIPIAIQANAARVCEEFLNINCITAQRPATWEKDDQVLQWVFAATLRLLMGEPPNVFLCHTKAGGIDIAHEIRRYLYEHTQLSCFFDRYDIPHGHRVTDSIVASISKSMLLVIWTEDLLERPWCQFEIIEARKQQRPILVVDALRTCAPRMFPFFSNMPVVRWSENPAIVVNQILIELIRINYLERLFENFSQSEDDPPTFGFYPPDMLDSSFRKSIPKVFVYPDPPIRTEEVAFLRCSFPDTKYFSLNEWLGLRATLGPNIGAKDPIRLEPLTQLKVGISVSASDAWAELGLIPLHQEDLTYHLTLQLILLGAQIVWGGDLRPDGLGQQLQHIVQTYHSTSRSPQAHIAMTIPFFPGGDFNSDWLAARRAFAEVLLMDSQLPGYQAGMKRVDQESVEGKALKAFALSAMRTDLANLCDARIVLGGGMRRFQGIYPGVAEEAYKTVQARRPLYILAGFGGAAGAVFDTICGRLSGAEELRSACETGGAAADPDIIAAHSRFVALANSRDFAYSYPSLIEALQELGIEGLSKINGLSPDENHQLAKSQDIREIVSLVVRGLSRSGKYTY